MKRRLDTAHDLMPLTPAVYQVLLAVADGSRHGLGILEEVEAHTGGQVRMGPGTLYGTLHRMVASGLLEESEERPPAEHDDPRRRYYRITDLGRRAAELESSRLESLLRFAEAKRVHQRTAVGSERGR